jgi:AcrR family transcriptional regulator
LEIDSNSVTATSTQSLETPVLRKTERTRLRLVEAVRCELEEAGAFTAEQAARRAGSSPATFYNHFGSKDDALCAAFAALMDDLVAHVDTHLRVDRLLELGLERFARAWVIETAGFFRANSRTFAAAQMQMPASKGLRDIFRDGEAAALVSYERFIRLGQAARALRAGAPGPIALAFMIGNQGWNHPRVLRMQAGDALHCELAQAVVRQLGPASAADGSATEGSTVKGTETQELDT